MKPDNRRATTPDRLRAPNTRPSTGSLSPSFDENIGDNEGEPARAADACAQGGLDMPQGQRQPTHFANPANPEMTP